MIATARSPSSAGRRPRENPRPPASGAATGWSSFGICMSTRPPLEIAEEPHSIFEIGYFVTCIVSPSVLWRGSAPRRVGSIERRAEVRERGSMFVLDVMIDPKRHQFELVVGQDDERFALSVAEQLQRTVGRAGERRHEPLLGVRVEEPTIDGGPNLRRIGLEWCVLLGHGHVLDRTIVVPGVFSQAHGL